MSLPGRCAWILPTWKVSVNFPEALVSAGPFLTEVLQLASLQIEVVPQDCCILRSVSSFTTSNDLVLHVV